MVFLPVARQQVRTRGKERYPPGIMQHEHGNGRDPDSCMPEARYLRLISSGKRISLPKTKQLPYQAVSQEQKDDYTGY